MGRDLREAARLGHFEEELEVLNLHGWLRHAF
jgi:hypothetical protein